MVKKGKKGKRDKKELLIPFYLILPFFNLFTFFNFHLFISFHFLTFLPRQPSILPLVQMLLFHPKSF